MPSITQDIAATDWLKYEEASSRFSRERITLEPADVAAGLALSGQPIGEKDDGSLAPWTPNEGEGADVLVGVLLTSVTSGDAGVAIVRHAVVSSDVLVEKFGAGRFTLAQLDAALKAIGIIARKSV